MPAYTFEYVTDDGPCRETFSLDDDRPLGPQVQRVLSTLREKGVIVLGGRDDELFVEWNGARLDVALTPATLGLSAVRPINIRMKPRSGVRPVRAQARSGAPRTRFVPLGVVSAAFAGALGAASAWTVLATLPTAANVAQDRDALGALLLLSSAGFFIALVQHGISKRMWFGALGVCIGASLSTALAMAVTVAVASAGAPFLVQRLILVGTVGMLGAVTIALSAPQLGSFPALLETAGIGMLAGLLSALGASIESLGVTSALAWPFLGGALGATSVWPRLRRAYALCELLPPRRSVLGTLAMHSYALPRAGTLQLGRGTTIVHEGGDVLWSAAEPMLIDGKATRGNALVVNGDRVQLRNCTYRFRVLP